eukprot:4021777-Pyramimonas_sp.AAC.1
MAVWMLASALAARQGVAAGAAHQILTQVFWVLAFVPEAFTPVAHILIGRTRAAGQRGSRGGLEGVIMAFVPKAFTPVAHILIGRTRAASQVGGTASFK